MDLPPEKGVYLVNLLGIVYDPKTKQILIGRRENDPLVPQLGWSFPGGRPHDGKSLNESLVYEIEIKTGILVSVDQLLLARIPSEHPRFLLYYACTKIRGETRTGEKFVEAKWVNPREIRKYFTTSIHPQTLEYLRTLE